MAEYIERKALREAFDNADADVVEEYEDGGSEWGFGRQNILEVINSVPAADVAPVRHGRCKKSDGKDEWYTYYYTCVECGANMMVADADYHDVSPNYCPICAARMDLEIVHPG